MPHEFGVTAELKIHEEARFVDGLAILLTSFSHKRPYVGGPTKATAYLSISYGDAAGEIMISTHGVEGKSPEEDGLSDSQRYDTVHWERYEIRLKSFYYDRSIAVVVNKPD